MVHGIVMFSGGLDSVVTAHLLKSQGISVTALHFVLPFYSGLGFSHKNVKKYADVLGVKLRIVEEGEEFLTMIKDPQFGFGKNVNPCLDCRIQRLKKAKGIMEEEGASFIATGEVIGQRPMSQRRECMESIEEQSGLKGILVRPLSAKLMEPTLPEIKGLINREKLLGLSGRSRKPQLDYIRAHGLSHSSPAGGCILTDIQIAKRYLELSACDPWFTLNDFRLLAFGRHFRLNSGAKLIIARNDAENYIIEKQIKSDHVVFDTADIPGPLGIAVGEINSLEIGLAASLVARYSKARDLESVKILVRKDARDNFLDVKPADEKVCEKLRI